MLALKTAMWLTMDATSRPGLVFWGEEIELWSPVPTCYHQDSTELNHAIQGKDWLGEFGGRVQKGEGSAISVQ